MDRAHRRGNGEQHDQGEDDLHDLPGRALPGHRAQAAADVAASRPWRTPRCTSPSTPPGSAVLRNCER